MICPVFPVKAAQEQEIFYLERERDGPVTMGLSNDYVLPVSSERYDKFALASGNVGTELCPNLQMGIKYIHFDGSNPDSGNKWRYVYCLDAVKESPTNGVNLQFEGWANKEVLYAMYYGAVYYGQTCRYQGYSTGDWRMDYFVTQTAIHVLNHEFDLPAVERALSASNATWDEIDMVYPMIKKLVTDAYNPYYYGFLSGNGFVDMSGAFYDLKKTADTWSKENGKYVSDGYFYSDFLIYGQFGFKEQLTGYDVTVPAGVEYTTLGPELYSRFRLEIQENMFRQWQLTGKKLQVSVTASIPKYWGAGIYSIPGNNSIQPVCLVTCMNMYGNVEFTDTEEISIPQETKTLEIEKRDAKTQELIAGAQFSLWAFDGTDYTRKIADFQDMQNGKYKIDQIRYTDTVLGRFLIREDIPPKGYEPDFITTSEGEKKEYETYHGREIFLNENGFYSKTTQTPLIFSDRKIEKRNITIRKRVPAEEVTWAHGNPAFFFKVHGIDHNGEKHVYYRVIQFTPDMEKTDGTYYCGQVRMENIPAGTYYVEELEKSMRYILEKAWSNDKNVAVAIEERGKINGIKKIHAIATVNLEEGDGSVEFLNRKIRYDDFSHNDLAVNHLTGKNS